MSRRDEQRLDDILAAVEAIHEHLGRGGLDDGLVFDRRCGRAAVRQSLARRYPPWMSDATRSAASLCKGGVTWVPIFAAMFYIAWSHPGRCRNEAAFARLAGAAPLPATSGQSQNRHRLNRGGDRQLNSALYIVALTRAAHHEPTRAYGHRRRSEGKTDRETRRCVKRYIARRVWRFLEHPPITQTPA